MATPLMNLSLPTVSTTPGPAWATALNAALTVVDGHDHSSGKGARVTPTGLNINADLTFAGFNATNLRSSRMVNHSAVLALATDASCLSVVGGNLYYNNGAGTPIQITAGAALNAASIGAIGGDYSTSTASVFYTAASQFFTFWQAANKSANLDVGKVIIREPGVVSPNGITLQSPAGLAAAYSLTLPAALPASTKVLGLGSTGILQSIDAITLGDAAAISLPRAGAQTILKGGTGKLQVGTSVNEDVEILRNNVVILALTAAGTSALDPATKGYVEERHSVSTLAADFTTTSSSAVDTGLEVSIKAGVSYQLQIVGRFLHGAASDQLLLTPSTPVASGTTGLLWSKEGAAAVAVMWEAGLPALFTSAGADTTHFKFDAILIGGAADATVKLQVDGASAGPTKTVYAGTHMVLHRLT